jgi:hypothetical protein
MKELVGRLKGKRNQLQREERGGRLLPTNQTRLIKKTVTIKGMDTDYQLEPV